MYRLIQISAGLALVGGAAITLIFCFDAFIAPIPDFHCGTALCIPQLVGYLAPVAFFSMIFLVVALLSTLIETLRVRHWALASALLAQAIISFLGGGNLALNSSIASDMEATFSYDAANHSSLGAAELIMFTSVPLVLFLLPRTLPRWPHLLPALACLAVAGGALAFALPDHHYPPTRYAVLAAVYVLGWGAATTLLLVVWWIARRDTHLASQSAPTAHTAGESASE